MHLISLLFSCMLLLLSPLSLKGETLVEGLVAILTFEGEDSRGGPLQEVLFFSDLERYRLFFEPHKDENTPNRDKEKNEVYLERLDTLIRQKLLEPEAVRFIPQKPTEKEVENHLVLIRKRFKNEVAFKDALQSVGFDLPELKVEILRFLWVQKLIQERIVEFIFIRPREVNAYYLEHQKDYTGRPFEEIEKDIEALLSRKKQKLKIEAYVARLKEKIKIEVMLKEENFDFR